MTQRRVVVTGMGIVSPLGIGVERCWSRLCSGESGIRSLLGPMGSHFLTDLNTKEMWDKIPSQVAGFVPRGKEPGEFDQERDFPSSERRAMSLGMKFGMMAAEEALSDANWLRPEHNEDNNRINPDLERSQSRTGVAVGMAMVDLDYIYQSYDHLVKGQGRKVSPFFVPRILPNLAPGHISLKYGLRGPNHSVSTACATGSHAIGDAYNFVRHNAADVMICGGVEACISPLAMAGFAKARALSTKFNETPEKASRPFDQKRDGFVIGEGAGLLVLEELAHAQKRGAQIYAEVVGYGLSGDAHHVTAGREDGEGAKAAMSSAFDDIGHDKLADLWYVNAHATSTPKGDIAELTGLTKLLEKSDLRPYISSSKGNIGHLLGAAGSVESIFALKSLKTGLIPKNVNVEDVEMVSPQTEKIVVGVNVNEPIDESDGKRRLVLKNSFGFGGTNVSLLFADFKK